VTLGEMATLIRSKNAGPFMLTIDVMFSDVRAFRAVVAAGVIEATAMATLYGVRPEDVRVYVVENALAIKVSFPRPITSGDVADGDIFGGQQFAPLVGLEVPEWLESP
jgi:hypothetical protein